MANVNVKFNNKDYLLSCDDGQEESLKKLAKFLDKKYTELKDRLGNIGENKLLLITLVFRPWATTCINFGFEEIV